MNSPSTPPPHATDVFPRIGSSLYYALACAPATQREPLRVWLNWWHETAQIPLRVSDPGVAETKLRWWQQALQDAAQGQVHHPLLKAMLKPGAVSPPAEIPPWSCWQSQLDGLITLINQNRWLDDISLHRHALATTGAACEGAARLLGAGDPAALAVARQFGCGLRQAHQLNRLGQDARSGWVNVAIDVLQAHDVRAHQLSKPDPAQLPAGWAALLRHLHGQAEGSLTQALTACRALPRTQAKALRPLVVLAHIQLRQISAVAEQGDRVLHERIVLTPLRKWWISQQVRWGLLN